MTAVPETYIQRPREAIPVSRAMTALYLTIMIFAGAYMRVHIAYHYAYNIDETNNIGIAEGQSPGEVWHFATYETHPPLYNILLHFWMRLSAAPEFVRLLSLIFGVALIPVYYLIGVKIGGRLCGLCCAVLITLGYGCIIQSFVIRQYGLMTILISLHFLCYLHWRELHRRELLAGCIALGWMSVMTLFCSFFYFFCLALFEIAALLWRQASRKHVTQWIIANLAIAAVGTYVYLQWLPTERFYRMHDAGYFLLYAHTAGGVLKDAFGGLMNALGYMGPVFPIPLLVIIAALYIRLFWPMLRKRACYLQPYLLLAGLACCMNMALYATKIYPTMDTPRRSLWMLPLVVPVCGAMLAELLTRAAAVHAQKPLHFIAAAMFFILNDTMVQQRDHEFASWQNGTWQFITHTLATLGPSDVVVTDKDGFQMLTSPYRYKSDGAFMNGSTPVLVPYAKTSVLLSPDYFGDYSPLAVRRMLLAAQANHLLDHAQRLVFLKEWEKLPLYDVVTCNGLAKDVWLPDMPAGGKLTQDDFPPRHFALVGISKQALFDDVLSEHARERVCIDEKKSTNGHYYMPMTAKRDAQ